jgi:hypothetical protein
MALTQRDAPAEMVPMGPRARADDAAAGGQPLPAAGAHLPQPGRFDQGEGGHAGAQAGDNQPSASWGGGGQPGLQAAGWPTMPTRTEPTDRPADASNKVAAKNANAAARFTRGRLPGAAVPTSTSGQWQTVGKNGGKVKPASGDRETRPP